MQRSSAQVQLWVIHHQMENERTPRDLEAEAVAALDEARVMPRGPERSEALKKACILRNAAHLQGVCFAKRGRPAKT
jgi:hypothetical protein